MDDIDRYESLKAEAISKEATIEREFIDVWRHIRQRVRGFHDEASPEVRDFDMKPKREPKISIVTKAVAVAKRRATRKVRRTMGKRQRKNIKGW